MDENRTDETNRMIVGQDEDRIQRKSQVRAIRNQRYLLDKSIRFLVFYFCSKKDAGDLVVHSVNFLIEANSRFHRTNRYFLSKRQQNPKLIVRRGQPFELRITFERRFRYGEDVVSFVFIVKGLSSIDRLIKLKC